MDVRKYLDKLDIQNPEHLEAVKALAKAKAKYDVLQKKKHRKDPSLLTAALEFRKACDVVRRAGQALKGRELKITFIDESGEAIASTVTSGVMNVKTNND